MAGLGLDAIASVAYGPEAMLAVLALAGGAGLGLSLPISGALALMMLAVGVSYRQTIRAYPHGGGSYIVATENFGPRPQFRSAYMPNIIAPKMTSASNPRSIQPRRSRVLASKSSGSRQVKTL